jgi:hypothetical protein
MVKNIRKIRDQFSISAHDKISDKFAEHVWSQIHNEVCEQIDEGLWYIVYMQTCNELTW